MALPTSSVSPAVTVHLYLRLATAKQPTGTGKGQSKAGHTYHAKTLGASPGLPHRNLLTSLLPQNRVSFPIGVDSVTIFLVTLQ